MNIVKPPEQKELARQRSKAYYELNKQAVKAKRLANYHKRMKEIKRDIMENVHPQRYQFEFEQAVLSGKPVLIEEKAKYRRCPHCGRYYDQYHRLFALPDKTLRKTISCEGCEINYKTVENFVY